MDSWVNFDISKYNEALIVDFAKRHGREACVYNGDTDKKNKVDIALQFKDGKIYNIDTKYANCKSNHIYFEFEKHAENSSSKADYILYCLRKTNFKECYFVKRSALNKITNDGRSSYIPKKDPLKYFDIKEVDEKDKIFVDFSKLYMK
jgi:hypothetical protein